MEKVIKELVLKEPDRLYGGTEVNPPFLMKQLEDNQTVKEIYKLAIDNKQMKCEWGYGLDREDPFNYYLHCDIPLDKKKKIVDRLSIHLSHIDENPEVLVNVVNSDTDLRKLNYRQLYSKDKEPKYSILFSIEKFIKIEDEEDKNNALKELKDNNEFPFGVYLKDWKITSEKCEQYDIDLHICKIDIEGILDKDNFGNLMRGYYLEDPEDYYDVEMISGISGPFPALTFSSNNELTDEEYWLRVTPFLEDKNGKIIVDDSLLTELKENDFFEEERKLRLENLGIRNYRDYRNLYHKKVNPDNLKNELLTLVNNLSLKRKSIYYDLFKEYLESEL